jgi:hypothetical protein
VTMSAVNLTTNGTSTDAASYVTASITPHARRLIVADVCSDNGTGIPPAPTLTGCGLTWVQVATQTDNPKRITRFAARGAPTTGTVTIDFGGTVQIGCEWSIYEILEPGGTNETNAFVQHLGLKSTSTGTTGTITLPNAPRNPAISRPLLVMHHSVAEATNPRASWTEIGDNQHPSPASGIETQIRTDAFEATGSATWATTSGWRGIISELAGQFNALEFDTVPGYSPGYLGAMYPQKRVRMGQAVETDSCTGGIIATWHPTFRGEWGTDDWGFFDWGFRTYSPTLPGRVQYQDPIGEVAHLFIGPGGSEVLTPAETENWQADEQVGFGYLSASCLIDSSRVIAHPQIYCDGAKWITFDDEGGVCFGGYMSDPTVIDAKPGGKAELHADGWGKDAEREFERLLYMTQYPGNWVPRNSEPFGRTGTGFFVRGQDKFTVDTTGHISFSVSKGTDMALGDQQGAVFWAEGATPPGLHKFMARVSTTVSTSHYKLRLESCLHPDDDPTGLLSINLDNTGGWPDFTVEGGALIDIDLPVVGDIIIVSIYRVDDGTNVSSFNLTITTPMVFGLAPSNPFTTGQVARDIALRLRWGDSHIRDIGFNALPLDETQGSAAEVLDRVAILTDWRHVVRNYPPDLYFGPWDEYVWTILETDEPGVLPPLPRFDQVDIPFLYSNGKAVGRKRVTSPTPLLHHRNYGLVSIDDPQYDGEGAVKFAQILLGYLIQRRYGGSDTFQRVMDKYQQRRSGHAVRAGDCAYKPEMGVTLRIASVHHTDDNVSITYDEAMGMVDRLFERRHRRWQQLGRVG